MPTINDAMFEALRNQGFTGSTSDMQLQQARLVSGLTDGNVNDCYRSYFSDLGYEGTLTDQWYQWLGDNGYEGALSDRKLAFWLSGGTLPPLP